MIRKSILFFAALTIFASVDAFAVASVKKLGTNSSSLNTAKPVATLPKAQVSGSMGESLPARVATISAAKEDAGDVNPARLSAGVNSIKTISAGKLTSIVADGTSQYTGGGISQENFNRVVERIEALESQNPVTDVVQKGAGNYVSDVELGENNKLEVTKTKLLYAPVRRGSNDAIVDSVEIWVVK